MREGLLRFRHDAASARSAARTCDCLNAHASTVPRSRAKRAPPPARHRRPPRTSGALVSPTPLGDFHSSDIRSARRLSEDRSVRSLIEASSAAPVRRCALRLPPSARSFWRGSAGGVEPAGPPAVAGAQALGVVPRPDSPPPVFPTVHLVALRLRIPSRSASARAEARWSAASSGLPASPSSSP